MSATITSVSTATKRPRVVIIGAGVVGLGIAWRLASRAEVLLFDRGKAGAGASHAAAGMLAACAEAEPGEEDLVALGRDSQARWPGFAEELLAASGVDVELRREGTLVLALTADDQATLAHHLEFQKKLGLPIEWLSAAATRAKEPHLAGKIAGSVFSPQDHQVDNRKLARRCASPRRQPAQKFTSISRSKKSPCRVAAPRASCSKTERVSRPIAWCSPPAPGRATIAGLPPDRRPPVRPIKGQMLALRMDAAAPLLNHVLWAPGAYLVPRRDGRLIVGAHGRGKRL